MGGRIAAGRLAWMGAGLLLLGGCASSGGTGSGSTDYGAAVGNLLAFNSLSAPPPPVLDPNAVPLACPTVEVLDGTASSRVYGAGEQTNANVKYQFSMGDVVRECSHEGPNLVLKIGVEGRVLIGPVGTPGSFAAPVRIAIRRNKDEKVIAAKFYKVPVALQGGESQAPFTLVSEPMGVPFITAHGDDDYTILVGFDAKGDSAATGVSPRKRHHRGA